MPSGYLLLQQIATYHVSEFGAISSVAEARTYQDALEKYRPCGVEYGPLYFNPADIAVSVAAGNVLRAGGVDLWLSSFKLRNRIAAFNGGRFPREYQAYSMTSDGSIVPAKVWSRDGKDATPAFDCLDPRAMDWFIERYRMQFLEPVKGITSGYFFNEDCLYNGLSSRNRNNRRVDYWNVPAYSDSVLSQWQAYCVDHEIRYGGDLVAKFPVHRSAMVPNGSGKTEYFPGYQVPASARTGSRIASLPRNTGVWAAWDDFLTSLFADRWIGRVTQAVREVNRDNPGFKGVIYFGLLNWSLAYEEVRSPELAVSLINFWMPWGTQRGVRLSKICAVPGVDYVVCETFPPVAAQLEGFVAEYQRIAEQNGKGFGVMLHRDDAWRLGARDAESARWDLLRRFAPTIIARYPLDRILPTDRYFDERQEERFLARLAAFRD